jgi:gas vesicle protein
MYSNDNEKSGLAIGSLVIGAIAGAIAGILFAPKSGKETRGDLKDTLTQVKDDVASKIADLNIQELTQNAYQAVVNTVLQTYEDAKKLSLDEVRNIRSDLDKGYEEIKEAATKARDKADTYTRQ